MSTVLEQIVRVGVLPVVVLRDAAQAQPLAEALLAGGIPCAEITLRTDAGLASIRAAADVPGFTVGAGTVLTPEQAEATIDAGARFLVSPGLDPDVLAAGAARGVPAVPGVATAGEVQRALRAGAELLKLFPADVLGGPRLLKAFAGPFPDARFVPSGGVGESNLGDYLAVPTVAAVSGSWMVPAAAVEAGDFATVQRLAAAAVEAVRGR